MKPNNGKWGISCDYAQLEWKILQLAKLFPSNTAQIANQNTLTIRGGAAIGGITSSGLTTYGTNNLSISLDDFAERANSHVKKYQVLEIDEDLLVLSATWYRLREQVKQGKPYVSVEKLTDVTLFNNITEDDRTLAFKIRDYYSKKIMMWKLKGQSLTRFREDMNHFIHGDGKIFKEEMCPLVYRLPEFYHYDIQFDELANDHNKIVKVRSYSNETKSLNLVKTFIVGKRHSKRKEYWFTDINDNLVTLSLTHDNPLLSLLDLASKEPLTISAKFKTKERDNVQYMYAEKYTFS